MVGMSTNVDAQLRSRPPEGYGRVGGALSWSVLAKALRGVLLAVNSVLVVRLLGKDNYGYYSLTRTIVGFLTVLCWMGLTQALLRYLPELRVSGNSRGARRLVLLTLAVQFTIWAVMFAATVVFRTQVQEVWGRPVGGLLMLATGLMLVDLFVTTWTQVLTSWYELRDLSAAQVLGSAAYLAMAWVALRHGYGAAGVLLAAGLSNLGIGLFLALDSRRFLELAASAGEALEISRVVRYSLPFAAISLLNLITWRQSETLILGAFCPVEQVGFFDRAYTIPQQFLDFVPAAIWPLMMASFSEVYARDPHALPRAVRAYYKLLYFLAAPISVWGAALASRAMVGVYGAAWAPAGPLCAGFFLLFAVTYLSMPLSLCLYVMEKTWINLIINLGNAAFIVGLDFLLIPRYGMWGAMVPVGVVILGSPFLYYTMVRRFLPQVGLPWGFILRAYLAAAPLAVLALATSRVRSLQGLLALSAVAMVVSVLAIRLLRLLGEEERVLLEKLRLPLRGLWLRLLFREARA